MEPTTQATFAAALTHMEKEGAQTYGPETFQTYAASNGLPRKRTWAAISVDRLETLSPELRHARTMVFRLGSSVGDHRTSFGLARVQEGWSDFFLIDSDVFKGVQPQLFLPSVAARELYVFDLLPRLTEPSFVNLAIASGLLSEALNLDERSLSIPATGQSTFSFQFRPLEQLSVVWDHSNGQVEVDALFLGKRQGKEMLFVVEAKASDRPSNLAKHKLLYPLLAIRSRVPEHLPLVPVYVRAVREGDNTSFYVAECELVAPTDQPPAISSLRVVRSTCLILPSRGMPV